jgi:hypothetical protein
MKTKFNKIDFDWVNVKNKCRTTVNKDYSDKAVTDEFKENILISEHTPIRLLNVDWSWNKMKSWIAVHWVRHKWEKFVSTHRDDRFDSEYASRDEMPQGIEVNFDGVANMQNLIDTERKRLCFMAHKKTKAYAEDFKVALYNEGEKEAANVLVPNCIYRMGCPEFKSCKFIDKFIQDNKDVNLFDIKERYRAYNEWFYKNYREN